MHVRQTTTASISARAPAPPALRPSTPRPHAVPPSGAAAASSHPLGVAACQRGATGGFGVERRSARKPERACRAYGDQGGSSNSKDPGLDDYVEVKVDSVRVSSGASIVFLRLVGSPDLVLPVHIGENESQALLKEINKQKGIRPLTHDCTKNIIAAVGYKVSKIRITELVSSTYYSRIHLAPVEGAKDEVDLDARPSDAINLAVRFNAPMYISKRIAENATAYQAEAFSPQNESHAEIVRSVRETLASFEDPTTMLQLQKELAVQEERYADAQMFQNTIFEQMTHSVTLRLVVAMEAALADGRYEEAARVRDEYRRLIAMQATDGASKKQ